MIFTKKLMLVCASAALLTACTTGYDRPHYGPARGPNSPGYVEQRIEENRYRVEYRTDRRDRASAEDLVFRRAAELTRENGYDWFQVIGRNRAISDQLFDRYDGLRYRDDRYGSPDRRYPDYRDRVEDRYRNDSIAMLEIVMGYNPPPRGASIYEARRVLDRLAVRRF